MLFDKIASVYFTWKKIYILALEMAWAGNQLYRHTFVAYDRNVIDDVVAGSVVVLIIQWNG